MVERTILRRILIFINEINQWWRPKWSEEPYRNQMLINGRNVIALANGEVPVFSNTHRRHKLTRPSEGIQLKSFTSRPPLTIIVERTIAKALLRPHNTKTLIAKNLEWRQYIKVHHRAFNKVRTPGLSGRWWSAWANLRQYEKHPEIRFDLR